MAFFLVQFGMATILLIALVGLFFPEKIQNVELKASEILTFGLPNPLVSILETERYLWMVRLFGAFWLILTIAAEYVLFLR